jgi:hypothetical protein
VLSSVGITSFPQLKQISIQRSTDSLSNFKSLITVPDPNNKQNGYLDSKAPNDKMFYRLYILVDGANFIFSKSKRPTNDSIRTALLSDTSSKAIKDSIYLKLVEKILSQNLPDSALTTDELLLLRRYRNGKQRSFPIRNRKIDAIVKTKNKPML